MRLLSSRESLTHGLIYGLIGAAITFTVTYLGYSNLLASADTNVGQLLSVSFYLVPVALISVGGWLTARRTHAITASMLLGALIGVAFEAAIVVLMGAVQVRSVLPGPASPAGMREVFGFTQGLRDAAHHLSWDTLRSCLVAGVGGAVAGALSGWLGCHQHRRQPA